MDKVNEAQAESTPQSGGTVARGHTAYRAEHAARAAIRTRVLWAIGYGFIQPLLFLVFLAAISEPRSLIDPDWSELASFRFWVPHVLLGFMIGLLQLGLLLPIMPPRLVRERPSWARCGVTGAAIASAFVLATFPALVFRDVQWLDHLLPFLEMPDRVWAFEVGCVLLAGGALTVLLRVRYREGMPLWSSLAVIAFLSTVLGIALIAALAGVARSAFVYSTGAPWDTNDDQVTLAISGSILVGWAIATLLLVRFKRRTEDETWVTRLVVRLFIGTVVEFVATIPFDVMLRRKNDCYCSNETFWSLLMSGTVGFVFFGPFIFLLPLGRRMQRLRAGRCPGCGYDMSAIRNSPRCPECGLGWATPNTSASVARESRQ